MNEEHLEDAQKRIEMLENELNRKDEEMEQLKKDLYQAQGRLQEIREEKEELTQQVSKFELMQMDLELMKAREDRKSTRLNSSHSQQSRMPSSA